MATSSPMDTSNTRIKYTITITENSQNIINNTTNVTVSVRFYRTNTGYTSYGTGSIWCKIDGTTYEEPVTPDQKITNSGIVLFTKTLDIAHGPDGTKDLTCSAWISLRIPLTSEEQFYTQTLTTIPRVSEPSVSPSTIVMGQTMTISTNRASTTFTHKLYYGWYTVDTWVLIAENVGDSTTWNVPLSFANSIPASTQGNGTIRCETYSGSTLIGTKSVAFVATVPESVKPSASVQVLDATDYQATYGNLVKGKSRLYVKVTGWPSYESPIASYSTVANGDTYTVAEFTTGALKSAGTTTVSATVKDKRGRTGAASASFPVIDYNAPAIIDLTVHRCDEDGTENEQGEYVHATLSAQITPLNNHNSATYALRYRESGTLNYTTLELPEVAGQYTVANVGRIFPADGSASYDVEAMATDDFTTVIRASSASTAFTLMNWHPSGTGMGVGKVSELENTMEVALNTRLIGNRYTAYSAGESGTAGFVCMARIVIRAADPDSPITFVFNRRTAAAPMTVHLRFASEDGTSSTLTTIKYEGENYLAYANTVDDVTWDLYVQKVSGYDSITLQDWYTAARMTGKVSVYFPGGQVSQVPTPYYRATPAVLDSVIDMILPVHTIISRYDHADPNAMYPGTTWVRIANTFLWGTDTSGQIGQTGGEQTHTLTAAEMPVHKHSFAVANTATGDDSATNTTRYNNDDSSFVGTLNTEEVGGGAAHNNMPPYTQVSFWRRTA